MILVDTSAWIEYGRATESPTDNRLTTLISSNAQIAASEPILMEVLAGARSEAEQDRLHNLLTSFNWITLDPMADFEGAAAVYRACRAVGITPSGLVDCMIANLALRTGASLLAADSDFERIATVVPLRLDIG